MEHEDLAVAARIEAFALDEPGVMDTFSRRLARENGWSAAYTRRVVREYKRFLTLAVTTTHAVSPSEPVDQAWHLHVLYSARYRRFCAEVLGCRLDHGPSDGGSAEREHFVRAYEQTLVSYQQRFGEPPPPDVWPNARRRFGSDLAVRRVNTAEHWVVRKPRAWLWLRAPWSAETGRATVLLGALAAFLSGCRASLSEHADGPSYLRGFLWLWLVTVGVAYVGKKLSSPKASSAIPVLEPYALAQLAGGAATALDSALTSLIARGCVELDGDGRTLLARRPAPSLAPAFEHDVYGQIARTGKLELRELREQASVLTQALAGQLLKAELVTAGRSTFPLLVALVAPVVGTFRILSRLGSDKPISLLVLLTVVATLLAVWAFRPRRERTALGDATLARARAVHEPLQGRASAVDLAESGTLPIMFSLFGTAAILGLPEWTSLFDRRTASHTDSGCGTSCGGDSGDGGGGCGSGCGGCSGGD
jgi:uncharacterized protein (TIGR04222 family)